MGSRTIIYIIFDILGVFCMGIPTIFKAKDIFLNAKCVHLII